MFRGENGTLSYHVLIFGESGGLVRMEWKMETNYYISCRIQGLGPKPSTLGFEGTWRVMGVLSE